MTSALRRRQRGPNSSGVSSGSRAGATGLICRVAFGFSAKVRMIGLVRLALPGSCFALPGPRMPAQP